MNEFYEKHRLFVSYRVNFNAEKYPNAPTMLQQDAIIAKAAESRGAIVVKDFLDIDEISSVNLLCQAIDYTKEKNGILTLSCSDSIINSYEHIKKIANSKIEFLFCDKPQINNELLLEIESNIRAELQKKKKKLPEKLRKMFDLNRELRQELRKFELAGDDKAISRIRRKISSLHIGRKGYYTNEGRMKGGQSRRMIAQQDEANKKAFEIVNRMMFEAESLATIANTLNLAGYRTSRGCKYFPASVRNLANLYRPKKLDKTTPVIKDEINERLYNELLNDEEAYKDIHESI